MPYHYPECVYVCLLLCCRCLIFTISHGPFPSRYFSNTVFIWADQGLRKSVMERIVQMCASVQNFSALNRVSIRNRNCDSICYWVFARLGISVYVCVYCCPCLGVTHYQRCLITAIASEVSRGTDHSRIWLLSQTVTNLSDVPKNNCCQSVCTNLTSSPLLFFIGSRFWKQEQNREERRQQQHPEVVVKKTRFYFILQGGLKDYSCSIFTIFLLK